VYSFTWCSSRSEMIHFLEMHIIQTQYNYAHFCPAYSVDKKKKIY